MINQGIKTNLFVSLILLSISSGQYCEEGYVYIEDIPSQEAGPISSSHCFYEEDLAILQSFIDLNPLFSPSSNNLEPINLVEQMWSEGRLFTLIFSFGNLMFIPENIGDLLELRHLHITNNEIYTIPESIGNLVNLNHLSLNGNNLISLPESICNLEADIFVSGNNLCEEFNTECIYWFGTNQDQSNCCTGENGIENWTQCEDLLLGDLSQDGIVNITDVVIIVGYIFNEIPNYQQFVLSNLNDDYIINILDIVRVVQIILSD